MAAIAISILALGLAYAQGSYGEVAGHPYPIMMVGNTEVYNWTLVNNYNTSLSFYIIPINLSSPSPPPTVSYSASCTQSNPCTIQANDRYSILLTIIMYHIVLN